MDATRECDSFYTLNISKISCYTSEDPCMATVNSKKFRCGRPDEEYTYQAVKDEGECRKYTF